MHKSRWILLLSIIFAVVIVSDLLIQNRYKVHIELQPDWGFSTSPAELAVHAMHGRNYGVRVGTEYHVGFIGVEIDTRDWSKILEET